MDGPGIPTVTPDRPGQPFTELHLRDQDGVPEVNSRDVAEAFGKRHDHVLRDIKGLDLPSNRGAAWFIQTGYVGEDGTTRPSFDLTR